MTGIIYLMWWRSIIMIVKRNRMKSKLISLEIVFLRYLIIHIGQVIIVNPRLTRLFMLIGMAPMVKEQNSAWFRKSKTSCIRYSSIVVMFRYSMLKLMLISHQFFSFNFMYLKKLLISRSHTTLVYIKRSKC